MKVIDQEPVRRNLTIEFTPQEQDVLFTVCAMIGGNPSGPRGVIDELKHILQDSFKAKKLKDGDLRGYLSDKWDYVSTNT